MDNFNKTTSEPDSGSTRIVGGYPPASQLPYISPTPGQFPIIASTPFSHYLIKQTNPDTLTEKMIDEVIECGFNVGMELVHNDNFMDRILELSKGKNFRFMPSNDALRAGDYQSYLDNFKNEPGIGAWYFLDEPATDTFNTWQTRYNFLIKADSSKMFFINLLGKLTKKVGKEEVSILQEYAEKFQSMFKPALWSYDNYPLRKDANGSVYYSDEHVTEFYHALDVYSKIAKETDRPFWAYCQSASLTWPNEDGVGLPVATKSYLRYEAFSALAYGAQGIVYWTYAPRNETKNTIYGEALIDRDGNRTESWYDAQEVNKEIQALSPVFLGAKVTKVEHVGTYNILPGYNSTEFGPVRTISTPSAGATISLLENNNRKFLSFVNHSPFDVSEIYFSLCRIVISVE